MSSNGMSHVLTFTVPEDHGIIAVKEHKKKHQRSQSRTVENTATVIFLPDHQEGVWYATSLDIHCTRRSWRYSGERTQ